jgi:hypothetical protein
VFGICPLELYSQHFILIVTYDWAQRARVLHYTRLERSAWDKQRVHSQVTKKINVFATLHFLCRLQMGRIIKSVCPWQAFQKPHLMFAGQARSLPKSGAPEKSLLALHANIRKGLPRTLQLTWPIRKLRRK